MEVNVRIDVKNVEKMLADFPANIIPPAIARALNKTIQSAKSTATKSIAANIGIKQQDVRSVLDIDKANRNNLTAILKASSKRRLPVIKIDPRATQDESGVSYKGQDGQIRHIDHAFIATMRSGHRGVFKRKPDAKRLPIIELQGPSIQKVFVNHAIQEAIKSAIDARWQPNLDHEVWFELQRRGYTK